MESVLDPVRVADEPVAQSAAPAGWRGVAWLALASRLAAMVATLLTVGLLVPRRNPLAGRWDTSAFAPHGLVVHTLLGGVRWDALWYLKIAHLGYADEVKRAAFFPLYPMLIRVLTPVLGRGWIAGTVISVACTIGAAVVLQAVVRLLEPERPRVAPRAAVLWLLFPAGAFLGTVYPESLLCLLFGLTWLDALRGKPLRAGVWAGLALLTKPLGIAAFIFVLLVRPRLGGGADGSPVRLGIARWQGWVGGAIGGAIAAIWPVYLWIRFGQPTRFKQAQMYWNRDSTKNPWPALHRGFTTAHTGLTALIHAPLSLDPAVVANLGDPVGVGAQMVINLTAILFVLVIGFAAWRIYGLGAGVFTIAVGVIPLLSASSDIPLLSAPRFALVAMPAFVVLARLSVRWRTTGDLLIVCSGLAFGITACGVAAWQWMG